MTRKELITCCLAFPGVFEDYPFDNEQSWTVMRHLSNRKGFAHIYERDGRLCINLKCEPFEADFLRQVFKDVSPAYHMNKVHWNTVVLGGDVLADELKRQIGNSYDLT